MSLGQSGPWTTVPWTNVSTPKIPLDRVQSNRQYFFDLLGNAETKYSMIIQIESKLNTKQGFNTIIHHQVPSRYTSGVWGGRVHIKKIQTTQSTQI